jgi:GYF domain 2
MSGAPESLDQNLHGRTEPNTTNKERHVSAQWFYSLDGRTMIGPCTADEMKQLAATGQILPTHRVQRKGRVKTVMARNVKGLFLPAAK